MGPYGLRGIGATSLPERNLSHTGTQFCCQSGRQMCTSTAAQQSEYSAPGTARLLCTAWLGLAHTGCGWVTAYGAVRQVIASEQS